MGHFWDVLGIFFDIFRGKNLKNRSYVGFLLVFTDGSGSNKSQHQFCWTSSFAFNGRAWFQNIKEDFFKDFLDFNKQAYFQNIWMLIFSRNSQITADWSGSKISPNLFFLISLGLDGWVLFKQVPAQFISTSSLCFNGLAWFQNIGRHFFCEISWIQKECAASKMTEYWIVWGIQRWQRTGLVLTSPKTLSSWFP